MRRDDREHRNRPRDEPRRRLVDGIREREEPAHLPITLPTVTIRKSAYRSLAVARSATPRAAAPAPRPASRSSRCRSVRRSPASAPICTDRRRASSRARSACPWRGRAGQTLRRWLELDEETFYATFFCASVTRCYPGPSAERPRRPHADAARAGALRVLARLGARAAPPAADRHGRRARAPPPARPRRSSPSAIGERFELDGVPGRPAPASVGREQLAATCRRTGCGSTARSRLVHAELERL